MDNNELWAKALAEAESPERDAGLWARCYAESSGDEGRAKAAYIRKRVEELTPKPTRGFCPNCNYELSLNADACPDCKAMFNDDAWKPTPRPEGLTKPYRAQQHDEPLNFANINHPRPVESTVQLVRTQKSRGVYIILGLFFGMVGIHNFYAGRYARGVMQMLCTLLLGWFVVGLVITGIWCLVDFFSVSTDGEDVPMS